MASGASLFNACIDFALFECFNVIFPLNKELYRNILVTLQFGDKFLLLTSYLLALT